MASRLVLVMAAIIVPFSICQGVVGDFRPRLSLIEHYCNNKAYATGDLFGTSVFYVLSDLANKTPDKKGYEYRNKSPYPGYIVYGFGSCSKDLTAKACYECLVFALITMLNACPRRTGVHHKFQDCDLRYETYEIV
ncbi:hypothetical protein MLD38_031296 [Melastoma candidum]|uniref:Uncharacterized protein n=1 Tax=Melastoma candidum TaxID=119954 RepID=A0ACB9MPT3_9MYRT|nr:hypothetical protein MLD38_031296 [Melastoma candidum]